MNKPKEYVGKRLLFSLKYLDENGKQYDFLQQCGKITKISNSQLSVVLQDGSEITLPPGIDVLDESPEGATYTLRNGSKVINPDYTAVYIKTKSGNN